MKTSNRVPLGSLSAFLYLVIILALGPVSLWAPAQAEPASPANNGRGADPRPQDVVLLGRARNAAADQRFTEAEQYLLEAIGINPKNADALFFLGLIQGRMGKYLASVSHERKCLELRPDYASAYSVMGRSLAGLGELKGADEALQKAIQLDPRNATSYVNLAAVKGMLSDYKSAVGLYKSAIKISPNYSQAYLGLSTALGKLGDKAGQLQAARDAVKAAPGSSFAHGRLGFLLSQNGDSGAAMSEGMRANALRLQDSWNDFLGMFLTAWASVFLAFACIFGVMFAGAGFKPQEGEQVIRSFFLTFYKDRPGRFVVTDTRLVFVPESFSAWFGATRVSIQRPQIESINYLSTVGGGTVSILTRDQSVHQFRMPLLVLDPLRSLLVSQGLTSRDPAEAFIAKAESLAHQVADKKDEPNASAPGQAEDAGSKEEVPSVLPETSENKAADKATEDKTGEA